MGRLWKIMGRSMATFNSSCCVRVVSMPMHILFCSQLFSDVSDSWVGPWIWFSMKLFLKLEFFSECYVLTLSEWLCQLVLAEAKGDWASKLRAAREAQSRSEGGRAFGGGALFW